jgi:hypothetical protein
MLALEMRNIHLKQIRRSLENKNHAVRKEWICASGVVMPCAAKARPKSIREDDDVSHGEVSRSICAFVGNCSGGNFGRAARLCSARVGARSAACAHPRHCRARRWHDLCGQGTRRRELKLTVADNAQIAGIIKASLSDIKQNSFVAVTAMPQPDGSLNAVEVHIFPESMRGTGEGHYPWDLQPQSTMTNANVEQVVSAVDGRTLTLKYKDGEKKITVPR